MHIMRTLFICFLLGSLVWLIQQGPAPFSEPTAYLGILIVLPVLASRVAEKGGLPPYIGALIAGFLLGPAGLFSRSALDAVQPFSELATAWVGLYLGASLSPSIISDRRSLYAASAAVIGTVLITSTFLFLTLDFVPVQALQMGILAALAAPFFTHFSPPGPRRALSFSLLTTGLGLVLWGIFQAIHTPAVPPFSQPLLALVLWGIGIELVYRCAHRMRTEPGRYILFGATTLLILIASRSLRFSPLFLSLLTGLALSLRCGRNREPFRTLEGLSGLLVSLVLADFAARLNPVGILQLAPSHWQVLLIYAASMAVGKTVGSILGSRLTASSFRDWSQILPQGLLAGVLMPHVLPPQRFTALSPPAAIETGLILICGIAIPILLRPVWMLVEKIEINRVH